MKIIGQSTLANGSPYLHLGYLAATVSKPHPSFLNSGLALLMVGLVVALSSVLGLAKSNLALVAFIRRRIVSLIVIALVMVTAGAMGIHQAYRHAKKVYTHPIYTTQERVAAIWQAMVENRAHGKPIPPSMAAAKALFDLPTTDGWLNEMRLDKEVHNGNEIVAIVSAGPDEKFGTTDDIRLPIEDGPTATRPSTSQPTD